MDTDAIKGYLREVDQAWEQTNVKIHDRFKEEQTVEYATFQSNWSGEFLAWKTWFEDQIHDWWLADDVYNETRRWHYRQKQWELAFPSRQTPPATVPQTTDDQDKTPNPIVEVAKPAAVIVALGVVGWLFWEASKR